MKKLIVFPIIFLFLIILFPETTSSQNINGASTIWKAGVSKVVITPEQPMWMAGYSMRDHPANGTIINNLWAKALILEDMTGKKALLITTDLE